MARSERRGQKSSQGIALAAVPAFIHSFARDTQTLRALEKHNRRIYRAWRLKDEFEQLWTFNAPWAALRFFKRWTTSALRSRLEPLRRFVPTAPRHQAGILAFVETRVTNAVAEGLNRIVKIVKNRASGFRHLQPFADMIYLTVGDLDIPAQIPASSVQSETPCDTLYTGGNATRLVANPGYSLNYCVPGRNDSGRPASVHPPSSNRRPDYRTDRRNRRGQISAGNLRSNRQLSGPSCRKSHAARVHRTGNIQPFNPGHRTDKGPAVGSERFRTVQQLANRCVGKSGEDLGRSLIVGSHLLPILFEQGEGEWLRERLDVQQLGFPIEEADEESPVSSRP